jgi:hypothetical protein
MTSIVDSVRSPVKNLVAVNGMAAITGRKSRKTAKPSAVPTTVARVDSTVEMTAI